jgi:hypothetical protein
MRTQCFLILSCLLSVLLSQETILLGQNTSIGWSRPVKYDLEHQASALLSNAVTLVVKRLAQRVDADRGHDGCVANRVGLPISTDSRLYPQYSP